MGATDPECVCVCVCVCHCFCKQHTHILVTHTNIWLHAINAPWTRQWNEHISSCHWAACHPYQVIPVFSVLSTVWLLFLPMILNTNAFFFAPADTYVTCHQQVIWTIRSLHYMVDFISSFFSILHLSTAPLCHSNCVDTAGSVSEQTLVGYMWTAQIKSHTSFLCIISYHPDQTTRVMDSSPD